MSVERCSDCGEVPGTSAALGCEGCAETLAEESHYLVTEAVEDATEPLQARIAELEAERDRLLNAARAFAAQIDRRVDPAHGLGAEFFHNNPEYRAFRRAITPKEESRG